MPESLDPEDSSIPEVTPPELTPDVPDLGGALASAKEAHRALGDTVQMLETALGISHQDLGAVAVYPTATGTPDTERLAEELARILSAREKKALGRLLMGYGAENELIARLPEHYQEVLERVLEEPQIRHAIAAWNEAIGLLDSNCSYDFSLGKGDNLIIDPTRFMGEHEFGETDPVRIRNRILLRAIHSLISHIHESAPTITKASFSKLNRDWNCVLSNVKAFAESIYPGLEVCIEKPVCVSKQNFDTWRIDREAASRLGSSMNPSMDFLQPRLVCKPAVKWSGEDGTPRTSIGYCA